MAKPDKLKSLDPKLSKQIQEVADKNGATILSFVAPQAVRTSPVTFAYASIDDSEIFRLEEFINQALEKKATEYLHFVIHTPGGSLFASYKIANVLRSKFSKISAFIPYEAASGGTILCCAANDIYIGELGNLTSIDPQIQHKNQRVSCNAFLRAVESIEEQYGEKRPAEVPTPWQQMTEKLDPVIYDEMNTSLFTTVICASKLLTKSGYEDSEAFEIAYNLTRNIYLHEFPLFSDDAKEMGFKLCSDPTMMNLYAQLVSSRLNENSPRHAIDTFFPRTTTGEQSKAITREKP